MEFKAIATGFCFLEAPRVSGEDLWFSDLLQGGVYRRSPDGTIDKFLPERFHVGGICVNHDGKIICGGPGALTWLDPETGKSGAVLSEIPGETFLGANDFLPDRKGGIYFGTLSKGADYSQPPTTTELYLLDKSGKATKQNEELKFSNGIGLSPDGSKLYHVESLLGVFVYDVGPDGTLTNKQTFTDRTDGDGMAVDAEGGVWLACMETGKLARYRPDGTIATEVAMPHVCVTSICFGGPDWRDMYVVTAGDKGIEGLFSTELPPKEATIFHARVDIPGVPVPQTQFDLG